MDSPSLIGSLAAAHQHHGVVWQKAGVEDGRVWEWESAELDRAFHIHGDEVYVLLRARRVHGERHWTKQRLRPAKSPFGSSSTKLPTSRAT